MIRHSSTSFEASLPPSHREISLFCLPFQCSKPWRSPGQHAYLLTGHNNVANLTRSFYFHLRRLRAIRLLSRIYINCSCLLLLSNRLDYCNSLLVGLLSPLQSVLIAARLIVHFARPTCTCISQEWSIACLTLT